MGRHSSRDLFPVPPVLRLTGPRARSATDRTVTGVRFPIVDDLSQIAADDRFLDYLAAGRSDLAGVFAGVSAGVAGGSASLRGSAAGARSIAPMLATWRAEIVEPSMPEVPSIPAPRRVMRGPADKQPSRSLKPILGVAAAVCALLMGSVAVGAHSAEPGDALWGLTRVLYSSHAESVKAKLEVTHSIEMAQDFLDKEQAKKAVAPLSSADIQVQKVDPSDGQKSLKSDLQSLWIQVNDKTGGSDGSSAEGSTNAEGAAAAVAASSSELAKNSSGVAKHTTSPRVTDKAGTTTGAIAGKPAVTSINDPSGTSSNGSDSHTPPGVPIPPPVGPTDGSSSNPGTDTGSPATSVPAVPVPSTTDPTSPPDPGTSTTSEVPPPVTTDAPTTPDPSTSSDPPTTEMSTTSVAPTPTPSTSDPSQNASNNDPASVENAQASQ